MPVDHLLTALKEFGAPPALLGFGISEPEQVKAAITAGAAGAIGNCTKAGAIAGVDSSMGIGTRRVGGSMPRSRIHRRT